MKILTPRLAHLIVAFALTVGAFGLAHAQHNTTPTNDSELSKRTKKLGILVTAGYRAHIIKRGTLVNIGNKLGRFVSHDQPDVADAIFNAISSQVGQEQRYEISRVAIEPEAARKIAATIVANFAYAKGWETLLAPYYETCNCDALLVVTDGSAENMFSEISSSYGPSFSSKAAVSNTGDAVKAHLRLGLLFMLIDPASKDVVRVLRMSDVPDYSEDVRKYWPGEGEVPDEYWGRLVTYVGSPVTQYQRTLFGIGLRPSCALPYFERDVRAQQRGNEAPATLPGADPSKCPPAP